MHFRSQSPFGKFWQVWFPYPDVPQEDRLGRKPMGRFVVCYFLTTSRIHIGTSQALSRINQVYVVCELTLRKAVPRLLLPLQAEGRVLKPSLIYGDCWDENTAMDAKTGHALVFNAGLFYGHNEYVEGNWSTSHKCTLGAGARTRDVNECRASTWVGTSSPPAPRGRSVTHDFWRGGIRSAYNSRSNPINGYLTV